MKSKAIKFQKWFILIIALIAFVTLVQISAHTDSFVSDEVAFINAIPLGIESFKVSPFKIYPFNFPIVIFLFLMCSLVLSMAFADIRKKSKFRLGVEKGSAAWNTDYGKYNKQYTSPEGKKHNNSENNMIITNDVFLSMNTRQTMRNNNMLVVGGSGSGKSRFFVKPNLLQANCSFVVTDPSGELLETTGEFLKQQGYEIKVFNLVQMDKSHSYNPFNYIRNQEGVLTMINAFMKNTNPDGNSGGDPFWEKSESALLQAICFYLHYEVDKKERSLSAVSRMVELGKPAAEDDVNPTPLDYIFQDLEEKDPNHIAVRQYKIFKQAGTGKTAMSILISAAVRLTAFNLEALEKLTSVDNIDLQTMGDRKTALFCITPVSDTTFNFLVAMLYNQLFETLYYHAEVNCPGKRLPYHLRFLLDEFANIGTIPEFEQKLATMRKYEISCSIIIQNLAQIKTMYKDSWESITGNCDTFLFLGGQEQTTLEYVSKKLGKETFWQRNIDKRQHGQSRYIDSHNIEGRDLMTPDEIGMMPNSNCISFIRGVQPFYSKKYNYPKHPNYKYTGDSNDDQNFNIDDLFNTQNALSEEKDEEQDRLINKQLRDSYQELDRPARKVKRESARGKEIFKIQTVEEAIEDYVEDFEDIENIDDVIDFEGIYNPGFEHEDVEFIEKFLEEF